MGLITLWITVGAWMLHNIYLLVISLVISFYAILLLHEGAHYILACKMGLIPDAFRIGMGKPMLLKLGKIEIYPILLYGAVYFKDNRFSNADARTKKVIALAGPLADMVITLIALALVASGLFSGQQLISLGVLIAVGAVSTVFNLIPIRQGDTKTDGWYVLNS